MLGVMPVLAPVAQVRPAARQVLGFAVFFAALATINPAWLPGPIQPQVAEASLAMVFQVNGVRRASIPAAVSSLEQALDWMYEHHPEVVAQYLSNGVERWIFVPGRVVNAVVKPTPPRPPASMKHG